MPPVTVDPNEQSVLPSIDVVKNELDREQESYERRASSVDTKAGLILTAAGVVVSFRATQLTLLGILAQVVAALAGALAVLAFLPRVAGTLSPLALRNAYVHRPEAVTKLAILDTRLTIHADDERQLKRKASYVRAAVVALGVSVVLAVLGSIVMYAGQGGHGEYSPSRSPGSAGPSEPTPSSTLPTRPSAHR